MNLCTVLGTSMYYMYCCYDYDEAKPAVRYKGLELRRDARAGAIHL